MINVKKVAALARLKLSGEEEQQYQKQLEAIFKYFGEVSTVNTDGIEPLVTPTAIEDFWREDQVKLDISTEEALSNAPQKGGQLFKVPPVV